MGTRVKNTSKKKITHYRSQYIQETFWFRCNVKLHLREGKVDAGRVRNLNGIYSNYRFLTNIPFIHLLATIESSPHTII